MNELRLRELGLRAEEAVDLPDLAARAPWQRAALPPAGRGRRRRDPAGTGGAWLVQDRRPTVEPAPPISDPVHRLPGPKMEDLEPGTYGCSPRRRHRADGPAHRAPGLELLAGPEPVRRAPRR